MIHYRLYHMEYIFKILSAFVIFTVAIIIMVLLVKPQINIVIKSHQVIGCINASRVDTTYVDGSRLSGPNKDWYDICMDEINK